jgi:hypothetical protein
VVDTSLADEQFGDQQQPNRFHRVLGHPTASSAGIGFVPFIMNDIASRVRQLLRVSPCGTFRACSTRISPRSVGQVAEFRVAVSTRPSLTSRLGGLPNCRPSAGHVGSLPRWTLRLRSSGLVVPWQFQPWSGVRVGAVVLDGNRAVAARRWERIL